VDIREADHNLVLSAELPGVSPNDVEVRLENNTLYLKGERKLEAHEQSYHQIERVYGPFARAFTLPDSVDPNNVEAELKDGVLIIKLAKREEAKPRTVKIQIGGGEQKAMAAAAPSQS
jgi:HSP20 family protein